MFGTIEVVGLATRLLNILNIAPGENFAEGEERGTAEIHLMYLTFAGPLCLLVSSHHQDAALVPGHRTFLTLGAEWGE